MTISFPYPYLKLVRDYHIHTPLCHHATGEISEYVAAAKLAGLTEIGISDHNPMPEPFDDWRMSIEELPKYIEMVAAAGTEAFGVQLGLECDFIGGYEWWIEELAKKADWDYLIGSVHYIGPGWDVDNPRFLGRFTEGTVEEIWDLYWRHYLRCIESGLFDFVAHPDLPKKFGYTPKGDLRRYYEPAIEKLMEHNLAFEINTAGLRKQAKEAYPALAFLRLGAEAGVPLLINSDAHAPNEVGFEFKFARDLALEAGYRKSVRFEKRRRVEVDL
jgi:histidinol-phosphatase (PHP family)